MEKRVVVAFGLSVVLLFAYLWVQERYFAPPPAVKSAPKPAAQAPPKSESSAGNPTAAAPRPSAPPAAETSTPRPPQRVVPVETPLYAASVSSEGGKFQSWTLHYRGDKPMIIVGEHGPTGLTIGPADSVLGEPLPMAIAADRIAIGAHQQRAEAALEGRSDDLLVREVISFDASSYVAGLRVSVRNNGPTARTVAVTLPWTTRADWSDTTPRFLGQLPTEFVWSSHGHVNRTDSLHGIPGQEFDGDWIGVDSVWYLAALIPREGGFKLVTRSDSGPPLAKDGKKPAGRVTAAVRATPTIAPGETWSGEVWMFLGPKEYEYLKAVGLEGTLNFGGFPVPRRWGGLPMEWLGVPILLLMKWIYRYVGNYGLAIILLTVVSKVLFYPLTVRSMRSMKAMQTLQPQVNALRAKYKGDPQRAQREMMELYRKHKVNPMGGCLPMVAQVPIFYALYLALSVSVELQNAAFLCASWLDPLARLLRWLGAGWIHSLWICDLANPDPLYILPLLMGVTMFVQQKMTPTMGDPRQARMMLVMPFVFTIMFVNLASGLVLYWTVSNVLQILQQWLMERSRRAMPVAETRSASKS